jgi:tetratricopeptide (TPR) repeat protein
MANLTSTSDDDRLSKLYVYLEADPLNPRLLAEAADLSFHRGQIDDAKQLIDRLAGTGSLEREAENLSGLVALAQSRFDDAADVFSKLMADANAVPALRFNLAWAYAMLGRHEDALDMLEDDVLDVSSHAPRLKIQMLHHLNRLDEGLKVGAALAARYPADQALLGALATLALDAEKADLAAVYASGAGEDGAGLAALGILALDGEDVDSAEDLFDRALESQPQSARAWIGKGLTRLSQGDAHGAVKAIDTGAAIFGTHLGSWIASAWAHFAANDLIAARQRFERALSLDPSFAETHGGLAVLDILEGHIEEGERRAEIALRLDRMALGGLLAKTLLLERSGQNEAAQHIRKNAMSTPFGPEGRTIGKALAALAFRRNPSLS